MYTYKLNDIIERDAYYVPVMLNNIIGSENSSGLESTYISSSKINTISELVDKLEGKEVYLDFSGIVMGEGGFDVFNEMLKAKDKIIVFYNLPDVIISFIKDDCKELMTLENRLKLMSTVEGIELFNANQEKLKELPKKIIRNFINKTTINKSIPFSSSNVVGNKYIDVKKAFSQPSIFQLIICELGKYINEEVKTQKLVFDKILCVSQNGAAIASALGVFLEKDIEYLMNIGPYLTIRDKKTIQNIKPKTSYIFVADMVCLGTEYKIAKTIIRLADSKLKEGLSVAKYLDYDANNTLFTLCEISDGDEFGYKITVEKKS